MRFLISLFVGFSFTLSAFSQNEIEDIGLYYYWQERDNYYVYADVANVREGAGTDYEIIDQLACGEEIILLEQLDNVLGTVNRVTTHWLKISYNKNGESKDGYIWGANLSKTQLRRGNVKFVFGVDRVKNTDEGPVFVGQVKAVLGDKGIVSRKEFECVTVNLIGAGILDDTGLEDVEKVITITFSGEACGVPTVDLFFAWNGQNLNYLIKTYSVGDADVYAHVEQLIFPRSINSYGREIIKYIMEYEQEIDGDYDSAERRYKTEIYVWDGNKLTLQNQNWKN